MQLMTPTKLHGSKNEESDDEQWQMDDTKERSDEKKI